VNAEDGHKKLKQQEVMYRVLADSVVGQLIDSGCDSGQLIDFASEVVRCITDRGVASEPDSRAAAGSAGGADVRTIRWHVEAEGAGRHRIRGGRVTLRPLTDADRPRLERWAADPEIRKTFSSQLLGYLLDHLPEVPADPSRRDLVVCREDGEGIGLVCLFNIAPSIGQAESAKLLGEPDARGKGYAHEAAALLLAYAFDALELRRVYLRTAGFNLHNIKLNEKIGYKFEGILRESEVFGDRRVDVVLMSMLAREFASVYRLLS